MMRQESMAGDAQALPRNFAFRRNRLRIASAPRTRVETRPVPVASAVDWHRGLLPMAHRPADLAVHFFAFDGIALVVLLLAAGDAKFDFGFAFLEIDGQGNERGALLAGRPGQSLDFAAMGQQLARALGLVIGYQRCLFVRVDVGVVEHQLTILDSREGILERRLTLAKRFDFAADQDDAALEFRVDVKLVQRPAVADPRREIVLFLTRHVQSQNAS